jgi:hypothetical protein
MPFVLMTGYTSAGCIVSNSGRFDVGGGVNLPSPFSTLNFFVEARYYKGLTTNTYTTIVPVTIGIRW